MRQTSCSLAIGKATCGSCLFLLLHFATFLVAQERVVSVPADPFMTTAQERQLLDKLNSDHTVEWRDLTINQLPQFLTGIPVWIDRPAMELSGIDPHEQLEFSAEIPPGPLAGRLNALLARHELTFIIEANRLVVTTFEYADERAPVRIYDVTLLVERVRSGRRLFDFESLQEVIIGSIEVDSWEINGGNSSIRTFVTTQRGRERGLLAITCPTMTHIRIQALLERQAEFGSDGLHGETSRTEDALSPVATRPDTGILQRKPKVLFDDRLHAGGMF
ncbi:MAG: hypothetical protein R3C53_05955 [Pirellulaceae bacterium]